MSAREARGRVCVCGRVTAWARERVTARGRAALRVWARGRVAGVPEASGGAWRRVGACLKSQKLLAARGGAYEVRSGRFWSQWTDRDEIYPMKVVLRQTETWR